MRKRKVFHVDSKQACFLCLKTECNAHSDFRSWQWSISQLCRYLKLECQNVFKISMPLLQPTGNSVWDETDLQVMLCPDCHSVCTNFDKLFQQLELIRLMLTASVKTIHQVITTADKDGRRVEEYRKLATSSSPVELINVSIAENLRNETVRKCTLIVDNALPKVSVKKIEEADDDEDEMSVSSNDDKDEISDSSSYDDVEIIGVSSKNDREVEIITVSSNDEEEDPHLMVAMVKDPLLNDALSNSRPKKKTKHFNKRRFKRGLKKCHICNKTVLTNTFACHYRTHTREKRVECPHCSERFQKSKPLKIHQARKHLVNIFEAYRHPSGLLSDQRFEAGITSLFQQTMRTPPDKRKRRDCIYCGKSFRQKVYAKSHLIQHHFQLLVEKLKEILASPPVSPIQTERSVVGVNGCQSVGVGFGNGFDEGMDLGVEVIMKVEIKSEGDIMIVPD